MLKKPKVVSRTVVAKKKLKDHISKIVPLSCQFTPTESVAWYWWHVINKAAFKNALPPPEITIRKLRGAWGNCNGENITISTNITNKKLFIATVAHEMVHQWQFHYGAKLNHGNVFRDWDIYFKKTFGIVL